MSVNPVIELKCEGHTAEYELTNVVNLFVPYINDSYKLEVCYRDETAQVRLCLNQSVVITNRQQVQESRNEVVQKKNLKETLKRMVYEVLSELTGRHMPWGILTGIRPTKIVHDFLRQGLKEEAIARLLKKDYKISDDKIRLMIEVAKRELDVLSQNKKDEMSIYIGIPFCPTRCVYCSFTAYSLEKKADRVDHYLEALCKEIDYVAEAKKGLPIRSLYIGGGTPTSLNEAQLLKLLSHIKVRFDLSAIEEYTVEAGRPDTITKEKLIIMKQMNVNRISINPQTMNQKTLDVIGRQHTAEDIRKIFSLAREAGHHNINMDMIVGLPNESVYDVENTLIELSKLNPENITVHTMAVKRASRLKEEQGEYQLTEAESIEQMLGLCQKHIGAMGLRPYYMYRQKNMLGNFENVGYARPGKECIYNIEIMEEKESIIALGAGAITKVVYQNGERIDRIANVKSLEDYISRIDEMIERKKQGFEKYQ
ncbi:MAG: Coproporphyrinogen dehydrogenase [Clostridia bacterium]|jgi:oxygen-independent coproporphyrinogen-3 oxidase|nr:Coproporphyrinogen dehydrogenase [Clostridia bacterium]